MILNWLNEICCKCKVVVLDSIFGYLCGCNFYSRIHIALSHCIILSSYQVDNALLAYAFEFAFLIISICLIAEQVYIVSDSIFLSSF